MSKTQVLEKQVQVVQCGGGGGRGGTVAVYIRADLCFQTVHKSQFWPPVVT